MANMAAAVPLNPNDPQRPQIIFRIPPNVSPGPQTPFQRQGPKPESKWKKALGPLAFIGVLLLKFATKVKFLILPVLKFLPMIIKTGGTMLLSIGIYTMMWGWKFALGFVLLITLQNRRHP